MTFRCSKFHSFLYFVKVHEALHGEEYDERKCSMKESDSVLISLLLIDKGYIRLSEEIDDLKDTQ